jgi:LysM repeat protein
VVQPGETVFSIAQRYGVTVDAIVQANNLRTQGNIVYISAGQTLIIPPAE